jgi:hypothetical protein
MSNHWSVYCVDCSDSHGTAINRGGDGMAAIIKVRAAWEAVAVAEQVHDAESITINYDGHGLWDYQIDPGWFLIHKGHILAPRSEYGYLLDDCSANVTCGECGTIHTCHRKEGHDGVHSPARDYDPGEKL